MKTSKFSQTLLALIATAGLFLVACNKGGGGGQSATTTNAYTNYFNNCPSCQGLASGSPLLVGVHAATPDNGVLMTLDILGQGTSGASNPKAVLFYSGPGSMIGTLRVVSAGNLAICQAAPGDYVIRPVQASMLTAGTMSGGQYEAVGPGRIVFRMMNSQFYNTDGGGVSYVSDNNRVGLNLILDAVNGQPCGTMSTY